MIEKYKLCNIEISERKKMFFSKLNKYNMKELSNVKNPFCLD